MKDRYLHSPLESGEPVDVLHVCTAIPVLARAGSSPAAIQGLAGLRVRAETAIPACRTVLSLRSHPLDLRAERVRNACIQE